MLYRLSVISNELITEDRMDRCEDWICTWILTRLSYVVIAAVLAMILVMLIRVANY